MAFLFTQRLRLRCLPVLLSLAGSLSAHGQSWQWATSPGAGEGRSTAVDAVGNVYVTGHFSGTATFGATTLTSAGLTDMFVAKLNSSGAYQWAARSGGSGDDGGTGVAVDGNGRVYVTGRFTGTATFGATPLTSAGGEDAFVTSFNSSDGAYQRTIRVGGSADDAGLSVTLDGTSNPVITGSFISPTIIFGATTLTNAGAASADIFVAKLTAAGAWVWATGAGSGGGDGGFSVTVDGSDNLVVTGRLGGPASFGSTTLSNAGGYDVFVAKLTSAGAWLWATSAGGSGDDDGIAVNVDATDNVVVTGNLGNGTATFGTTMLTNAGMFNSDVFVAKLTSAGAWQWATSVGGSSVDSGTGVDVDGSGNVVVIGHFESQTVAFGTTMLTSAGSGDVFVATLSPAGAWQSATNAGGGGSDLGFGVAIDNTGSIVATGTFGSGTATFGAIALANTVGGFAIFISRFSTSMGLPTNADAAALTLAPNPAQYSAILTGAPGSNATLLDGLGRTVRTVQIIDGAATLDVRGLPAGLYLARAGGLTRRLVVE